MNPLKSYLVKNQHHKQSFDVDQILYSQPISTSCGWNLDRFTQNMSEYICSICSHVYRDAMTLQCGHTFCQSCIFMSESNQSTCIECNTLYLQFVPDFSKRLKINQSITTCSYKPYGCLFIDTLQHSLLHEITCPYKQVSCEKCKVVCCKNQISHHMTDDCMYRVQDCEKCGQSIPTVFYDKHKNNECMEKELSSEQQNDTETCHPCRYSIYGCSSTISYDQINTHEQEIDHFTLVCATLEKREKEWKQKWVYTHQDGPYHIRTHNHIVTLCADGKEDECSECKKPLQEENGNWFGYYCAQGCMYTVCMDCFNNVRLYKSKTTKWYKK